MLPLLNIGDILCGTSVVGALRQEEQRISLSESSHVAYCGIFDESSPPDGWSSGSYRVLNRFEFELGRQREAIGSRCMRIRTGRLEYIIPCSVILRTFYGFHTKLANAICSGPWDTTLNAVISTARYDSGIGTYRNNETGAWNIVVQAGLTRDHAVRLALLYFDEYARACANAIHASADRQTHSVRADGARHWFADAKMPYQWSNKPFEMLIRGFSLRAHRPSAEAGHRFLVTSIEGTSWPFPDQQIFSEIANSNLRSPNPNPERIPETYHAGNRRLVLLNEDIVLDHHSDAFKGAPDNRVEGAAFEFLNRPLHELQKKLSHKEYLGTQRPPAAPPALTLSAGSTAPGEEKPAPLVAESHDRRLAPHLQLFLDALDALQEAGRISAYEVIAPPEFSKLKQARNGVNCWSLASEDQLSALRLGLPVQGWEFVFSAPRGLGILRHPIPRCLLIVRVNLDGHELLVFEIEPRLGETAYRFYALEPTEPITLQAIETCIINVRAYSGSIPHSKIKLAFCTLTHGKVLALNHYYNRNFNQEIASINTESLRRQLARTYV